MHFSLGKSKMQMVHFVDLEMLEKLMNLNFDKVINHSDYPWLISNEKCKTVEQLAT